MKYRNLNADDSKVVADIHMQAFTNFFLTELGASFLRTYYKAVILNDDSIAVCAENHDNKIVGFATGSRLSKGYNRQLVLKNLMPFTWQAIKLIFTRPGAIYRIIKNFEKKTNPLDEGNYSELLSIATLPEAQGHGTGKGLLKKFEEGVVKHGCTQIALTTDFHNNNQVVEFYQRNGYKIFYDFYTYPERRMYKMIKTLD